MEKIIFNDMTEGYKGKPLSKNQKIYGQYFFAMFMELYHVLYEKENTEKLDKILVDIRNIFPSLELNRNASFLLEANLFDIWHRCLKENELVISQKYSDELEESIKTKSPLLDYAQQEFYGIIDDEIYSNEELLRKFPTFLKGEFANFFQRQPVLYHNNIGYLNLTSWILTSLEKLPNAYDLLLQARENIVDIKKLDQVRMVCKFPPYDDISSFVCVCGDLYTSLKRVGENQIFLNYQLEKFMKNNPKLIVSDDIKDFLYYSTYNSPCGTPNVFNWENYLSASKKLQQEKLQELGINKTIEIYSFFQETKKHFQWNHLLEEQFRILNNIIEEQECLKRILGK